MMMKVLKLFVEEKEWFLFHVIDYLNDIITIKNLYKKKWQSLYSIPFSLSITFDHAQHRNRKDNDNNQRKGIPTIVLDEYSS